MKRLNISADISLPLDSVTQTFAILAKRRVGKTYTASVMAEEMAGAGLPFVVLDPTGAWWGLRSSADGKHEGLPVVIIGGLHGDLPLDAASGKVIAELVVEHPGFYVIDLSDTESDAAQDRFATAFAQRLYRLKDKHREPLHLFIDEADSFAPQRPLEGQKVMLGAFEALVRRGGIRGIGMTLITQRPAVLNKNVLTQCEVIIALQTTSPQDQDAVDDWVKRNGTEEQRRELMTSLASLKQGEAWFYSPAWLEEFRRIRVRERVTFNSSATPKVGERGVTPQKLAEVNLDELKGKIADAVAKAKENDPAELKKDKAGLLKRIGELERKVESLSGQLAQAEEAAREARSEAEPVEVPVITDAQLDALRVLAGDWVTKSDALALSARTFQDALDLVEAARKAPAAAPAPPRPSYAHEARSRALPAARAAHRADALETATRVTGTDASAPSGDFKLTNTQQRILDAIAFFESIGNFEPTNIQVGAVALLDATGGHFSNVVGPLSSGGLVVRGEGKMRLTEAGRARANVPDRVATLDEYHAVLRARVLKAKSASKRTVDILDVIISCGGERVTNEYIGQEVGIDHTGGHYSNTIGPLSTLGFIVREGGVVYPTKVLFPEGLR
jgi:hypothetical protein